jgi:general secretion pathway protein L
LAYAAALAGACPRLALPLNLLPAQRRTSTSRMRLVPAAALGALLVFAVIALGAISPLEDRKYLAGLEGEIARFQPQASRAAVIDRAIDEARNRTRLLDDFRRRSKADLDALAELTRIIEPPGWLSSLELTRDSVTLTGESEQSAGLLKIIDNSPLFSGSEFTVPLVRKDKGEIFRIRSAREGTQR